MLKLEEDLVITIAVAVGLTVALGLVIADARTDMHFPPTIIATFLAIALAALTYRFLGGVTGTEFSVGLLKLGGSAAFIVGLIYFVGNLLREDQELYVKSAAGSVEEIRSLKGKLLTCEGDLADTQAKLKHISRVTELQATGRCEWTVEQIRNLPPDDPRIRDLKQLVKGEIDAFRPTVREFSVRVAVIGTQSDKPLYNICEDTLMKLNEDIAVPQTEVLLSRSGGDGGPRSIRADRSGRIGIDVCQAPDRAFDIQVNCPVAMALFSPDVLTSCAEGIKAKGMTVSLGAITD